MMDEAILNPVAFALLLTSLYVLRFRGWARPLRVVVYFLFFAAVELLASHRFLPRGAFGAGLGYLCLALTVPVWVAIALVWLQEQRQGETQD
jgi:hypothetical protein